MPLVMVLSHGLSHALPGASPIVPPAREGRRRRFSEADKWQILLEAMRPDARFSEVARVFYYLLSISIGAPARGATRLKQIALNAKIRCFPTRAPAQGST